MSLFAFIRDLRETVRWYREVRAASPALEESLKRMDEAISGQIVGKGVAGRRFSPGEGTDVAY